MNITFLGTNGWYDSKTGNTLCILVQTDTFDLILDAGNGLAKVDRYCTQDKPTYLFISHYHLDHIVGLHTLDKLRFTAGLTFLIRDNSTATLRQFVNSPYTAPLAKLPFTTSILEIPRQLGQLPFSAECLDMTHPDPTIGLRFTAEGKTIAFCPDTGYCQNAVTLARNADVVITECAHLSGETSRDWPHLNPESGARIAEEANAKRLILTHFDARRYTELEQRTAAETVAKNIFANSHASYDGMQIIM